MVLNELQVINLVLMVLPSGDVILIYLFRRWSSSQTTRLSSLDGFVATTFPVMRKAVVVGTE